MTLFLWGYAPFSDQPISSGCGLQVAEVWHDVRGARAAGLDVTWAAARQPVADVCFLRGRGWPSIRQEIILELLAFEPSSLLIYE